MALMIMTMMMMMCVCSFVWHVQLDSNLFKDAVSIADVPKCLEGVHLGVGHISS